MHNYVAKVVGGEGVFYAIISQLWIITGICSFLGGDFLEMREIKSKFARDEINQAS